MPNDVFNDKKRSYYFDGEYHNLQAMPGTDSYHTLNENYINVDDVLGVYGGYGEKYTLYRSGKRNVGIEVHKSQDKLHEEYSYSLNCDRVVKNMKRNPQWYSKGDIIFDEGAIVRVGIDGAATAEAARQQAEAATGITVDGPESIVAVGADGQTYVVVANFGSQDAKICVSGGTFVNVTDGSEYSRVLGAESVMNGLPKTKENGFQHVVTSARDTSTVRLNNGQIWADTLFMTVLFLNKMGHLYNRQDWIQEATRQVLVHIKYLYDKCTGLLHHGWTFEENGNFGGVFWCRGNSWFTYGILEFLEMSKDTLDPGVYNYVVGTFREQCEALRKLQAPSGLWHTVLTDPESYEETSGSAAIAAGMIKGVRLGILDSSYSLCDGEWKRMNVYNSDGSPVTCADFEFPDDAEYVHFSVLAADGTEAHTRAFRRGELGI